ncbi:MAG: anti-sigma factor family protein [Phenylobacterium sp.]
MTARRGGFNPSDRDGHGELRELLPWYVTGQLDEAEAARVEAHLDGCDECQAELRFEERLESEVARLPLEVEAGWERMRRRVEAERPRRRRVMPDLRTRAPWLGWGVAAVLMLGLGVMVTPSMRPTPTPDAYRTLGAAPAAAPGNIVVIFRPDTTEKAMREALKASGARLVDGPTPADAYVLRVPAAQRDAALSSLRARREIVLAQPVDSAGTP